MKDNEDAKKLAIGAGVVIYTLAVIYGDLMFLQIMQTTLPKGILQTLSAVGAITTAASSIVLLVALHYWFSPGLQTWGGIVYWFINVTVLALNSMLA